MKVGTDGMLLGAWTEVKPGDRVLDIGTGTGVLALMMAQKGAGRVDAVELDESAAEQARENVAASPWKDRISVHHQPIQAFSTNAKDKYDLIICNPPYFANGPSSGNSQRDQARSGKYLPIYDLVDALYTLLASDGRASLILPNNMLAEVEQWAALSRMFVHRLVNIRPTPDKEPHRVLAEFRSGFPLQLHREGLVIRNQPDRYTEAYLELTKDFYLFP